MNPITILALSNVFFTGLLAGAEFIIHYGLRVPTEVLDEPAQLQLRQALLLKLRVLVPALFLPAAISGFVLLVLAGTAPGLLYRCVGMVAILTWIALRVVGTVPINSATLTWQSSAPPKDWKSLVDHAERFHIVGVWAAVIAFATALVRPGLY